MLAAASTGTEIRRFARGTLPRLAIVAIILMPLLYGVLYLWAFWNPPDHLSELPIAIVNADQPVKSDGKTLDAGADVVKKLEESPKLSWTKTTAADAADGVKHGKYYFSLEVPSDFSASVASVGTKDPHRALMQVNYNHANSFLGTTLGQNAMKEVRQAISDSIGEQAADKVLLGLGSARSGFAKASDSAEELHDGLGELASGASTANDATHQLAQGASNLATGTAAAESGVSELTAGVDRLATASSDARNGAAKLADGTAGLSTGLSQASSGASQLAAGLGQGNGTQPGLTPSTAALADKSAQLAQALEAGTTSGLTPVEVAQLAGAARALSNGATSVSNGTALAGQNALTLSQGVGAASTGAEQVNQGAQQLRSGTDQLASGADLLSQKTRELGAGTSSLASGTAQLSDGLEQASAGTQKLSDGASSATTGAKSLADGLKNGRDSIPNDSKPTTKEKAATIASPVGLDEKYVAKASSWGEGFAPFFMSLALFVGGIILWFIMRALPPKALAAPVRGWRIALSGLLPAVGIASLQAIVLVSIIHWALHLPVAHLIGAYLFAMLASWTFIAIQQALIALAGSAPGKVVIMALLMLQLTSASGTYPVETTPMFFRILHPFMPMSYSVEGLRMLITGGVDGRLFTCVGILLIMGLGAFLVTSWRASRLRTWDILRLHPPIQVG